MENNNEKNNEKDNEKNKEKDNEKDDVLFDKLKKAKRRKRRKVIITTVLLLVLAGVVVTGVVLRLRRQVRTQFETATAEVLSYQASSGRISTAVYGSGVLSYMDYEDVTAPEGVEVEEIRVRAGDVLAAGDVVATVDSNTVMTALADTQSELESLDDQISSAKSDSVSSYMTASVAGRVKRVYAKEGENVVDVMMEHGALAILSLDGYMTVTVDSELAVGTAVTVRTGENTYSGTVERSGDGQSVVSLTDDGPEYEAEAVVLDASGTELGRGALEIRSPLSITGYAGTVGWVNIRENQRVYNGTSLFTLSNTSYTANYDALLRTRAEQEERLNTLIGLLDSGCVTAPFDGIVTAVSSSGTAQSGDTVLATMAPNQQVCVSVAVDETDILSLELGQSAEVTISSVSDEPYTGVVTEISKVGTSSSGVTQYSAVVTLDKDTKMLSGMTASVEIQIQGVDNVVLIPVDALHQTRDIAYVFTSYDEELKEYGGMKEVVTGVSNSSYVEIVSGLEAGETVYYTENTAASGGTSFMMPDSMGGFGNSGDRSSGGSGNGAGSGGNRPADGNFAGGQPGRNGG